MKLERATIPLAPRSLSNCLDLAMMFTGRYFAPVFGLTLLVTIPCCALVWTTSTLFAFDMRVVIATVWFATVPLGALLISGAGAGAFGDSFDLPSDHPLRRPLSSNPLIAWSIALLILLCGAGIQATGSSWARDSGAEVPLIVLNVIFASAALMLLVRSIFFSERRLRVPAGLGPMLLRGWGSRLLIGAIFALCFWEPTRLAGIILSVLWFLPAIWLSARSGFGIEQLCLHRMEARLHDRQADALLKSQSGDLFLRSFGILTFSALLCVTIFFTIDACSSYTPWPILLGRLPQLTSQAGSGEFLLGFLIDLIVETVYLMWTDPRVLTTITATAMLVYPAARLAWFLCYVDIRVRLDCWDLELRFSQEATRLREAG